MGGKAWLFAGIELAGKRAVIVMSLVQSARLYGPDPWVYLKDVGRDANGSETSTWRSCSRW